MRERREEEEERVRLGERQWFEGRRGDGPFKVIFYMLLHIY